MTIGNCELTTPRSGLLTLRVQVRSGVDGSRHVTYVDLEAFLHLLQHSSILIVPDESNCQTLRAETSRSAKQICGHHDSFLEFFELLVASNSVLLIESRM